MRSLIYCICCLILFTDSVHAADKLAEAVRRAATNVSPWLVRIDTIGGYDKVGSELANEGATTGILLDREGYIITSSFNFLHDPSSILVRFDDGTRRAAKKVATDSNRMLTLLKVELPDSYEYTDGLRHVPKDEIRIGQWAIAVGFALSNDEPNVSLGIVSGKNRIWGKAIQTDAKISPNNYGGPLLDIQGRVIGILAPLSLMSTEVAAGAEMYDGGVGLAVPLEDVLSVLDKLKSGINLTPGILGISFNEIEQFIGPPKIESVLDDSPAQNGGMKKGDVITKIDTRPIETALQAITSIRSKYADDTIEITFERDGNETTFSAKLIKQEKPKPSANPAPTRKPVN